MNKINAIITYYCGWANYRSTRNIDMIIVGLNPTAENYQHYTDSPGLEILLYLFRKSLIFIACI